MEKAEPLTSTPPPRRNTQQRQDHGLRASAKKAISRSASKPVRITPVRACLDRIRSAWAQKPPRIVTLRNDERQGGALFGRHRGQSSAQRLGKGKPASGGRQGMGMMERYVLLVRLEADDIEPRRTAFALAEVVRQSSKPFRKQAREKGLRFKLNRLPDRAVMVYTDRSFLAQILQELLSNSVKFTRQGEIALTVEVQERTLLLHVSDTGIGIPEAALPAVFSGFRPALERAGTHTGWRPSTGLALVWGLVDAMGGRVEAASEEGHGSMFTITLPDVVTPPH